MGVREIPPGEWPPFLEAFSRGHRARIATVDRVGPDAGRHVEILERPLASVTADVAARRIIGIRIRFQEDQLAGAAVTVDAPTIVRVEETGRGAAHALEIENERGERTRIRFRIPSQPDMPDEVAPGELSDVNNGPMDTDTDDGWSDEERRLREAGLDDTIAATFPASDPPSSLPNPDMRDSVSDGAPPGSPPE